MSWDSIKNLVSGVAPVLGTLVGGPAGAAAATILSSVLGTGKSPADIALAISDPEMLEKIRVYELQHIEKLQALQIEAEGIAMKDRDSARRMQMQTMSRTPAVLSTVVVIGFFSVLYVIAIHGGDISETTREPLLVLLGALTAAFGQVFNFFFGSSAGSKEKTAALAGK